MKASLLVLFLLIASPLISFAQSTAGVMVITQYFDGDDTDPQTSVIIETDTNSSNIWQVGPPAKTIFDSAASTPNVLVTDTINPYPINNTSSFYFQLDPNYFGMMGVMAIQWKQKLDLDTNYDGGIIEYSEDQGANWHSAFNNPYIYNFYGYDTLNIDTLNTGEYAFSGTDSVWRDIWLCLDVSYFWYNPLHFRFTLKSDSVDNQREGWMIDNMQMHLTYIHGAINEKEQPYLKVYPNTTNGRVHIEAMKLKEYHVIESMELMNADGGIVQSFGRAPTKFYIDIGHHPAGMYYLRVTTNKRSETFPIILTNNK